MSDKLDTLIFGVGYVVTVIGGSVLAVLVVGWVSVWAIDKTAIYLSVNRHFICFMADRMGRRKIGDVLVLRDQVDGLTKTAHRYEHALMEIAERRNVESETDLRMHGLDRVDVAVVKAESRLAEIARGALEDEGDSE